jgi:photosystem II stability/assembly factor-like uncharacterized protein
LKGATVAAALVLCTIPDSVGATWTEQTVNAPTGLRVVHAVNRDIVWAVGNSGQVAVTSDGGANWTARVVSGAGNLRGVFAFDSQVCVISDQTGQFWRTTDNGANWILVHSVAGSSINGIHFFDVQNGWAMGDPINGHFVILLSTDSGWTWAASPNAPPGTLPSTVRSYDWIGTQVGAFSTRDWVIWRTTNAGALWDSVGTGIQTIQGMELSNDGIGLASGNSSAGGFFLTRSTDFGQTWSHIQHPPQGTFLRYFDWIETTNEVWATTNQTGAFQSTDEGLTWTQHILAPPDEFLMGDIDFVDQSTGWCVGERPFGSARIFKYTNQTASINVTSNTAMPIAISTSPNPFSAAVSFMIEGPMLGKARISIYDVGGTLIVSDSIEEVAGRQMYRWHPSRTDAPSGLYFYKVDNGTNYLTGKILRIR